MAYDKSWTTGEYSDADVERIGNFLLKMIQENEGEYTATIEEIGRLCGYTKEKEKLQKQYGKLFNALQEAKQKYKIEAITKGRKGNIYRMKEKEPPKEIVNTSSDELDSIKLLLDTVNCSEITPEKAIQLIKLIKKIIQ
ncbi:MAG: hypothetical protein H9893_03330 [Candidatus Niameybacter stercoravium]|nr:hypothetical protein [Candidatus Niameybacter stercoravium]